MILAAALAVLAAMHAPPNPLPDGTTIDALTYSFSDGAGGPFGAGGALSVAADGNVRYYSSSAPWTGSGGRVVKKDWELSNDERAELFRKLVDDGLLDTPGEGGVFNGIRVGSGRWWTNVAADKVPEKAMRHLRPLLTKADPVRWPKKDEAKPAAEAPKLTLLRYTLTPNADGREAVLLIQRDGSVSYTRHTHPTAPGGRKVLMNESWKLVAKDAAALLDALVTDGLLAPVTGKIDPGYFVEAHAGRWTTTFKPGKPSDAVMKHIRPLLRKADAEFWK